MLALAVALGLCNVFDGWPTSPGWTGMGLAATLLGFIVGAASLVITCLIFRWTNVSDSERHAELKGALHEMGALLKEALSKVPTTDADLSSLSTPERAERRGLLGPEERVVKLARSGSGKGNRPWQAFTNAGRVLQIYTGGRGGGVHAKVLE